MIIIVALRFMWDKIKCTQYIYIYLVGRIYIYIYIM